MMNTIKKAAPVLILLLMISSFVDARTFDRTYGGWWASTYWEFQFKSNGTYKRISSGHYGYTIVEGNYKINKDTVTLTGYEGAHGTVNEKYILDNDAFLIDLNLRYDYKLVNKADQDSYIYNCTIRNIKYPQIFSTDDSVKRELEYVLNLAFNSETVKKYCHFDKQPNQKLIIQKYYYLDAQIKVDSLTGIYQPKENIKGKFYIEFEDINQNDDSIDIKMKIQGEGVTLWLYYYKINGEWVEERPSIFEN